MSAATTRPLDAPAVARARLPVVLPRTRGDCPTVRPCPLSHCRYSLVRRVELETPPPAETCALDVTDAHPDGLTLEEVGAALGMTRERARQIEAKALERLERRLRIVLDERDADGDLVDAAIEEASAGRPAISMAGAVAQLRRALRRARR